MGLQTGVEPVSGHFTHYLSATLECWGEIVYHNQGVLSWSRLLPVAIRAEGAEGGQGQRAIGERDSMGTGNYQAAPLH